MKKILFWAADGLSFIRALLGIWLFVAIYQQQWDLAFALWGVGWATDLLDGLMARRFGSLRQRHPGWDSDGLADTVLAFAGTFGFVVYAFQAGAPWKIWAVAAATFLVIAGVAMLPLMGGGSQLARQVVRWNMLLCHAGLQVGGLWLAYMAGGWPSVGLTSLILLVALFIQRRKMALWWRAFVSGLASIGEGWASIGEGWSSMFYIERPPSRVGDPMRLLLEMEELRPQRYSRNLQRLYRYPEVRWCYHCRWGVEIYMPRDGRLYCDSGRNLTVVGWQCPRCGEHNFMTLTKHPRSHGQLPVVEVDMLDFVTKAVQLRQKMNSDPDSNA